MNVEYKGHKRYRIGGAMMAWGVRLRAETLRS